MTCAQVLEDIALTVQNQLEGNVPFCAFNGGNDVFVDVGNKSLGLQSLMSYFGCKPHEVCKGAGLRYKDKSSHFRHQ
jgi:IMP and pyridine-specific 5'-nucleotidase